MKTLNEAAKAFRRKFESEFIPEISERNKIEVAFIAGSEFVQRWIPVGEELPDPNMQVLCILKNPEVIVEGFIYNSHGIATITTIPSFEFWDYADGEVTHWRPINYK